MKRGIKEPAERDISIYWNNLDDLNFNLLYASYAANKSINKKRMAVKIQCEWVNVYLNINPIINNCIIENNNHGYYAVGGCHPEFTYNNQIINNTNYGIYLGGSSIATFGASLSQWNDIYGNGSYELYNGTDSTYATYIYWGTTDPEGISIEIYDHNDDPLLGYVKFYPYLNATHDVEYPEEISAPENVIIYIESDSVHLQWNSVNGANFYKVYLLDNPYSTIPADSTVVTDTTWTAPVSGEKKFYYIKAVK